MLPKTNYFRKFKGVAPIQYKNSDSVDAGAPYIFDLDERFKPFDKVTVINLDPVVDCFVVFNHTVTMPLLAGADIEAPFPIEEVKIINASTTTSLLANSILVIAQNTGHEGRAIIEKVNTGLNILGNISLVKGFFK